jgi:hypothetical protein
MLLIVFGALLVLCGIAHRYLVGIAQPAAFFRTGSRHSRALTARHAIPRARSELAGHSTYGNRRSSVVVGSQFLATLVNAGPKLPCGGERVFCTSFPTSAEPIPH